MSCSTTIALSKVGRASSIAVILCELKMYQVWQSIGRSSDVTVSMGDDATHQVTRIIICLLLKKNAKNYLQEVAGQIKRRSLHVSGYIEVLANDFRQSRFADFS